MKTKKRTYKRSHTRKKQKGGATQENILSRVKMLSELMANSKRFSNINEHVINEPDNGWNSIEVKKVNDIEFPMKFKNAILESKTNDGVYKWYKYTILPAGSLLYFRSRSQIKTLEDRSKNTKKDKHIGMWLNYSSVSSSKPFLQQLEDADPKVVEEIIKYFGPWLNVVKTLRPLKILHFPVDYEKTKPTNLHSYISEYEIVIRDICADAQYAFEGSSEICADGYTLDYLYRTENGKEALPGIGKNIKNYREICLLGVKEGDQLTLVESKYVPFVKKE